MAVWIDQYPIQGVCCFPLKPQRCSVTQQGNTVSRLTLLHRQNETEKNPDPCDRPQDVTCGSGSVIYDSENPCETSVSALPSPVSTCVWKLKRSSFKRSKELWRRWRTKMCEHIWGTGIEIRRRQRTSFCLRFHLSTSRFSQLDKTFLNIFCCLMYF